MGQMEGVREREWSQGEARDLAQVMRTKESSP